jgi:hypothetical protein
VESEERHLNEHKGKSRPTSFKQWSKKISDYLAELLNPSFNPEEADVFEAKKALQTGKGQPIANYLRDLAERLRRLAKGEEIPSDNGDLQVEEAIEQENEELLESFDRHAAFLEHLAAALDGAPGSWGWRLKFVRKRRGRPSDLAKVFRDFRVARNLASATQHSGKGGGPGKQESAIADLREECGISRSTVMRAKARRKGSRESH